MFSYYSQYGTIIRGFKKHKTLLDSINSGNQQELIKKLCI